MAQERFEGRRRLDPGQWLQRSEHGGGLAPFSGPLSLMDWMLRDFFGASMFPARSQSFQRLARMEVDDAGNELVVTAELPGLEPDDVQIECHENTLTLRGERQSEEGDDEAYVSFYREIRLPADVDVDRASASFKNGLLRIRFPKRGVAEGSVRRIPISTESRQREAASSGQQTQAVGQEAQTATSPGEAVAPETQQPKERAA